MSDKKEEGKKFVAKLTMKMMKHYDCGNPGQYKNTVGIKMPDWWETSYEDRIFHCDACIAPEIMYLIINGVRTEASCCGHGIQPPDVVVSPESEEKMKNLCK